MRTFVRDLRGAQADCAGISQGSNGDSAAEPAQERDAEEFEPHQSQAAAGVAEVRRREGFSLIPCIHFPLLFVSMINVMLMLSFRFKRF